MNQHPLTNSYRNIIMKTVKLLFLTVIFAILSLNTNATVVKSMNLSELTSDAQYIVKVTVLSKDTVIDTEESGKIVTYWTFDVLDWIKGAPTSDNQLVIKQVGQGEYTVDGYNIRQNYMFPEYNIGKTYVLFLPEAYPQTGLLAPVGLYQGVFEVQTENGHDTVPQLKARQNLLSERIEQTSKNKFLLLQLSTAKEEPTYDNFKSMIQSAAK